jgi:DNA gyrase subunit B
LRLQKRNNSYFYPDETIFYSNNRFSYDTLSACELPHLNKGITITFTDKRELDKDGNFVCEIFHSDEGLKEYSLFRCES